MILVSFTNPIALESHFLSEAENLSSVILRVETMAGPRAGAVTGEEIRVELWTRRKNQELP